MDSYTPYRHSTPPFGAKPLVPTAHSEKKKKEEAVNASSIDLSDMVLRT
jgi:hypothetical protein